MADRQPSPRVEALQANRRAATMLDKCMAERMTLRESFVKQIRIRDAATVEIDKIQERAEELGVLINEYAGIVKTVYESAPFDAEPGG